MYGIGSSRGAFTMLCEWAWKCFSLFLFLIFTKVMGSKKCVRTSEYGLGATALSARMRSHRMSLDGDRREMDEIRERLASLENMVEQLRAEFRELRALVLNNLNSLNARQGPGH